MLMIRRDMQQCFEKQFAIYRRGLAHRWVVACYVQLEKYAHNLIGFLSYPPNLLPWFDPRFAASIDALLSHIQ